LRVAVVEEDEAGSEEAAGKEMWVTPHEAVVVCDFWFLNVFQ